MHISSICRQRLGCVAEEGMDGMLEWPLFTPGCSSLVLGWGDNIPASWIGDIVLLLIVPGMMSILHTLELSSHYVLEFNIFAAAIVWRNVFRVRWIIVSEKIELSV